MNRFAKYLILGIALGGLVIAGCGDKKKSEPAGGNSADTGNANGGTGGGEPSGSGESTDNADNKTETAAPTATAPAAPANTAAPEVNCPKTCDNVLGVVMKGLEEKLAQMPPEQKAQLETQMKAQMARGRTQCMEQCKEKPVLYSCLSTAGTAQEIQACAMKHAPPQPPKPPLSNLPDGAPAPGLATAPPTKAAVKVSPETEALCGKACDNALSLANAEAQKRMSELPEDQRAKMEAQLQAFMAQGKSRCMSECRSEPERAQCVADAKDMEAMKACAPPRPRPAIPNPHQGHGHGHGHGHDHDHSAPGHKH